MFITSPLFSVLVLITALIIDYFFGEPKKWHPLIAFGAIASRVENILYKTNVLPKKNRWRGSIAVIMVLTALIGPIAVLHYYFSDVDIPYFFISSLIVYFCIAPRSLREHACAVEQPLQQRNLPQARKQLSYIVSRDVDQLSEPDIAAAVCESVLENGSDAIFAAIFWFLIAGVPGILIYRASNTLDAMWGYRSERYLHFGWFAAKLDDVLNWLPARMVALSYALVGNYTVAMRCWREQAAHWKSPNAGPVMSAGAGSLEICLGGAARYHGKQQSRPVLGAGIAATSNDISRALALVDRTLLLWIFLVTTLSVFIA